MTDVLRSRRRWRADLPERLIQRRAQAHTKHLAFAERVRWRCGTLDRGERLACVVAGATARQRDRDDGAGDGVSPTERSRCSAYSRAGSATARSPTRWSSRPAPCSTSWPACTTRSTSAHDGGRRARDRARSRSGRFRYLGHLTDAPPELGPRCCGPDEMAAGGGVARARGLSPPAVMLAE
jgi:hypothetical protein